MIVQSKHAYAFALDQSKGETPEMLLTALALAIFDLADSLDMDLPEILTPEQAKRHLMPDNRGVSMSIIAGRFCLAHVLTTSVSPESVEVQFDMYDRDLDALINRTGLRMTQLVRAAAQAAIDSLEDVSEFLVPLESPPVGEFLEFRSIA